MLSIRAIALTNISEHCSSRDQQLLILKTITAIPRLYPLIPFHHPPDVCLKRQTSVFICGGRTDDVHENYRDISATAHLVQLLDTRRVDHDLTGCTLPPGSRLLKENRTEQNTQQFVTEQMHTSTVHLIVRGICSHLQR